MSLIEKSLFTTIIKRIKLINSNNPVLTGLYFNLGGCDMLLDTIVAISTPLGEGAIGIIRLSGPDAFMIADVIFRPFNRKETFNRQMIYGHIYKDENIVDEVMLVKMAAPNTYTKENIVEINCHGGYIPLKEILELCLAKGARLAERGEFTMRAFLNGRIDLMQAESVMDLVSAKTKAGFNIALNQLEGTLSKKVKDLRAKLIHLMAQVEVSIDYPEEDIEEITYSQISDVLNELEIQILNMLKHSKNGKIIREGLKTVIIGKPNVGKSSLMNALLRDSRAIVTEVAGTTRDLIEEFMNIGGIPIKLVDTAGIRETHDVVEKIGVERSKVVFNDADLIIFMLNASEKLTEEDLMLMELVKEKHAIVLINKTDLEMKIDEDEINKHLNDKVIIKTSMELELGIDDVEKAIQDMVLSGQTSMDHSEMMSNTRHIQLIEKALNHVIEAKTAVSNHLPYDFIEVDIKDAILSLGQVTGESVESDLLNNIFSHFCLGK